MYKKEVSAAKQPVAWFRGEESGSVHQRHGRQLQRLVRWPRAEVSSGPIDLSGVRKPEPSTRRAPITGDLQPAGFLAGSETARGLVAQEDLDVDLSRGDVTVTDAANTQVCFGHRFLTARTRYGRSCRRPGTELDTGRRRAVLRKLGSTMMRLALGLT